MSGSSVVVGIDVGSQYVDVAVLGAQLGAERFSNDVDGHTALADALAPLKPIGSPVRCQSLRSKTWPPW